MSILASLGIKERNPGAYAGSSYTGGLKGESIPSYNPATEAVLAFVVGATQKDYSEVMVRAEAAFTVFREMPAPKRGEIIRQIAQALRAQKEALGMLVSLESGKSLQEGLGEVQEMIDIADFAVGQSRMLYGKTMHSERFQHRMYEQWHPYGVIGVISAFNFPVAVWAWNAFIAAICGNVTVWKPSVKTPLCAIAVHKICQAVVQANQCPDIFHLIIPATHDLAEQMVNDKRLPLISFTGSTAVGREVGQKVAQRLGRSILELGGNNAIIVAPSANLDLAIPSILFGAVGTAGQRCTSTRRLFIHQSIYTALIARLQKAYAQLQIGDPLQPQHHMGPLIDKRAVLHFQQAVDAIKALGGTLLFGGERLAQPGYYVMPTLVAGLQPHCSLVQEETFAPLLYVFPYEHLNEAIALQNAVPQGLSGALFTQDLQEAEYYLSVSGCDCGIANINIGTSEAEIGGAFGGEKETGGGRESGSDAWKAYMRRQTNTINWGHAMPLAQGIRFDLSG